MVILSEARSHLCAVDLRTGQPRWRFRAHGPGALQLARSGRVLCVTSGDGTVDALDLASGEVVWRFGDGVRFCLRPTVCREVVVAVAGEPRGANRLDAELRLVAPGKRRLEVVSRTTVRALRSSSLRHIADPSVCRW